MRDDKPDEAAWHDAERYRLLVQAVNDYAIFMLDPTGVILSWNTGAERLKQYTPEEAIGKHFRMFYPPEAQAIRFPEKELEVAARVGRYEDEGWRIRKDGSRFWANVVITALRDGSGTLRGFAKVTRDLTERRAAEEKLQQSEARLRLLIEAIHDYAVIMLDPDGRIATWNPGAQKIKQYSAEEIIGQHFSVFYPKEDVAAGKCDRELDIATATGKFEEENWRVRKDGTLFWANVIISAIRDDQGALIGFAKVTRDLTDRRLAEKEKLRLARAEEAVRMRDEFLSIASHELKTPLTGMQLQVSGLNRALAKGPPDAETLARLVARGKVVEGEIDRINKLVNDLLDVSRAASGKLHFEIDDVDLSQLARDVVERFADEATRAASPITLRIDDEIVGQWDRMRLDQVIVNFLTNAIKYGLGKPIEVSVARRAGRAVIAVTDHGIGIADADKPRVFDRFARAVSASHYGGLGLGLWIVRLIIEGMGGSVSVESKLGAGATFIASLPLVAKASGPALH